MVFLLLISENKLLLGMASTIVSNRSEITLKSFLNMLGKSSINIPPTFIILTFIAFLKEKLA